MSDRPLTLKSLSAHQELRDAVELQREIWGFSDLELLPLRLFVVATKVGGQVLGAYDGERMVGFLLAIPGLKPGGKSYLHSHMLGVLPEYRNAGVGRMLKLRQRENALATGVDLVEWTFDPLELKNAYFNVERLGAVIRRYVHNQYGTTSSHLHGGLPTDRLIPEWWIAGERAQAIVEGRPDLTRPPAEQRIAVPFDVSEIRRQDPKRQIQEDMAARFEEYFARGLAVIGFERSAETGTYLLGRWEPKG